MLNTPVKYIIRMGSANDTQSVSPEIFGDGVVSIILAYI
jgi:hypothetical protein